MSDLAKMAAKPVTMVVSGEEYAFSPLTLDDLAEFESWYESERMQRALDALGDGAPGDRVQLISQMGDAGAADIAQAMQSLRGVRQILWYSLRKRNPEMTPAEAGALVNLANLEEMRTLLDGLVGLGGDEESTSPPAARRSARGRAS
jgi:hypothetical protein